MVSNTAVDCLQIQTSEAMGAALVSNNFLPIPAKFSFHMKTKSDLSLPEIYKASNINGSWTESVLQEW